MIIRHLITLVCTGFLLITTGCDRIGEEKVAETPTELKAVISTQRGEFTVLLRSDLTPVAVANFVNLVQSGFYHGSEVANANPASFSVANTKYRTPNYTIVPSFTTELLFDRPGIIAWTLMDDPKMEENSIPHPTRFFVTKTEQSPWNLKYPSFGEVVEGIDVATATQKGDWIKSIRIVGDSTAALAPYADRIETWNAALENAKPSTKTKGQQNLPVPEGTRPVGS